MGLLSEFLAHIILISYGYNQKFLFLNLEEKSAKKGFDGLYTLGDDIWIMESKSGNFTGSFIETHKLKIKAALKDLDEKITLKNGNNPWFNALNHAKVVESEKNLLKKLEILDSKFEMGEEIECHQFCTIPSSTIFSESPIIPAEGDLEQILLENKYQKVLFLCISQSTVEKTEEYIREVLSNEVAKENAEK